MQSLPRTSPSARGLTVWFTGLSGAGKSTLARNVAALLEEAGIAHEVVDADDVRRHISKDLGFTREDRQLNVARLAYLASLLTRHGVVVLVAAVSPFESDRLAARNSIGSFVEVHVDCPIDVCETRDPVGLYRKFRNGTVSGLSGLDAPYEAPHLPELRCCTANETAAESARKVFCMILQRLEAPGSK